MKTLILDCNNLLYRTFWLSKNKTLTNSRGENVGGVYYFLNCVKSYTKQYEPDRIFAAWDKKLTWPSSNFRKEMLTVQYKGNRNYTPFEGVHNYDDLIQQMLSNLNIKNIYPNVMEADDVIAWLCHTLDGEKVVVSTDKDMWQLVNQDTKIFFPTGKKEINLDNFAREAGIAKEHYLLYKCILGDISDNVKGVEGYGKVKAKKVAENGVSMLTEEQQQIVQTNLKLSDLLYGYRYYPEEEICYKEQMEQLKENTLDMESFKDIISYLELDSITKDINIWVNTFEKKKNITKCIEDLKKRLNI
jgi:5'-3' exonuclease